MRTVRSNAYLLGVLAIATAYSILRYNVFKQVPWSQLPLWVANKAIAWAGLMMFLAAGWRAVKERQPPHRGPLFVQATTLVGVHVLVSLALVGPPAYPHLYDLSGQLTLAAQISLLAACIATAALGLARRSPRPSTLVLAAGVAVHDVFLGPRSWVSPREWPGGLPPITLLSFIAAVATLVLFLIAQRRAHLPRGPQS